MVIRVCIQDYHNGRSPSYRRPKSTADELTKCGAQLIRRAFILRMTNNYSHRLPIEISANQVTFAKTIRLIQIR